ncbi:MAG: hypothetical protein R3272_17325 [Candidatus Promineifilaceae bacterium]|nr:hypothetical protein [Candidatus Promineifilaceae bacterium]
MHRLSAQLYDESLTAEEIEVQSGPYLYPPTLSLLIHQLKLNAPVFVGLLFIAVVGFGWLWLRANRRDAFQPSPWWLLLIVLSWDVAATYLALNVELVLITSALLGAWLLWRRRPLLAALPIAFLMLIKPFFGLLIAAFSLLMLVQRPERREQIGVIALAAGASLILIALELFRWPDWLRLDFFDYFGNALAHQWLALPTPEQTPMSIWNRTPLQLFVNMGIDATVAQWMSLALWAVLLIVSMWWTRQRSLSFALTFALAYVLFLWGRPVSWTLPYLEIVILLAIWPSLRARWQRAASLSAAGTLIASHWLALFRSAQSINANLFTLQTATFPWETIFVLPLSWVVVMLATRARSTVTPRYS